MKVSKSLDTHYASIARRAVFDYTRLSGLEQACICPVCIGSWNKRALVDTTAGHRGSACNVKDDPGRKVEGQGRSGTNTGGCH